MADDQDLLLKISSDLSMLIAENGHLREKIEDLEVSNIKLSDDLAGIKIKMAEMKNYADYKARVTKNLMQWAKILIISIPLVISVSSYIAYDIGLYKPTPQTKPEFMKLITDIAKH